MCVKHTARSTLQNSKEELYEPVEMPLIQKSLKIYIFDIEFVGRLDE